MLGAGASFEVFGDVGHSCAHSFAGGSLLVRGNTGDFLGAYAQSGFLAVLGKTGHDCGFFLNGAEIVVRSVAGDRAGGSMCGGILVLANGTGHQLGQAMTGGSIFLRGDASSIAESIRKVRMKDADNLRLSLLLARAGIKGDVKEFSLYQTR